MISLRPALPPNNCDLRDSELALATEFLKKQAALIRIRLEEKKPVAVPGKLQAGTDPAEAAV